MQFNKIFFKKLSTLFVGFFFLTSSLRADEGMWIPFLLDNIFGDMQQNGLKLSKEQIYAVNKSSLKDAIVHFNGGCTAEVISGEGLILTNHHCGYSQIQSHSSLENDYLTDGFWAYKKSEELPNPGVTATFIVEMSDVTINILNGVTDEIDAQQRAIRIKKNTDDLLKAMQGEPNIKYFIRAFYEGNQFILFKTKEYRDVRLVGAPPSSIGKFGADTDNWMWPRHTGDFSLFRIYAGPDNEPADYSENNQPLKTEKFLKIDITGPQENDFTMIYGFPGRTQQYLPSYAVKYILEVSNPAKIKMRDLSLGVIDAAMNESRELRIKYAAKQSRISNAWKKWIGESRGLQRLDAINEKLETEALYRKAIIENELQGSKTANVLDQYASTYQAINPYQLAREMFIEMYYYGPELLRFSSEFNTLVNAVNAETPNDSTIKASLDALKSKIPGFYKNFDLNVDNKLMTVMTPFYRETVRADLQANTLKTIDSKFKGDIHKYTEDLYKKSVFASESSIQNLLEKGAKAAAKAISKDKIFLLANEVNDSYFQKVAPEFNRLNAEIAQLDQIYMKGLQELLPNNRKYYPNANSTLRIAHGKVKSYQPKDGVTYAYQTTLDGVMEKENPDVYEFNVPAKLKELYNNKDYGPYGKDGVMPVCFIASNHSTGGNSGSPVLNGNGDLIGLNFDRVWEGTMSDIMFDPDRCRNIMVDTRYILFIIDKFAGASNIIDELEIIKN